MVTLIRPEGARPDDMATTRRGLAGLFFAGYALGAGPLSAEPIHTDSVGLIAEEVLIPQTDSPLPAYIARPDAPGRFAAIVVVSEVFGLHEYIRDICRRIAKVGYIDIAPALFHRAGDPAPLSDFAKIQAIVETATNDQVESDLSVTADWLHEQPFTNGRRMGITGFCWGGAAVWMTLAKLPQYRAGVAWYGRLSKPPAGQFLADEHRPWPLDVVADLHGPVLGLYAGQDKGIPLTDVAAMRLALHDQGKRGSDIIVYPEAQHGFHADYRAATYDATAAADGWNKMLEFFAENGVGPRTPRRY